jgi:EAL domain-containing protein (putative c-di-GMP-specific phosphodiesterase class I)
LSPASRQDYFRLRAEWLRFKSHIFDAETDLPTFSAALDDIRRLLEQRGALGVVYVDPGGAGYAEPLHGWQVHDALIRTAASTLKGLRTSGGLGPVDLVTTLGVRSDKFAVFLGDADPALDETTLAAKAGRIREALAAALAEAAPSGAAMSLVPDVGQALLRFDPVMRAERAANRALDEAMLASSRVRSAEERTRVQALEALLAAGDIVTLYQPILDLRDRRVLGHEVFSRGPAEGVFEDPEQLFGVAARAGRLVELERLCRARTLESARRHLPDGGKLFVNTSAQALGDHEVTGAGFVRRVDEQGLDHGNVVLEITERVTPEERQRSRRVLGELKRAGFRVAIDDMGAGYSGLQAIVDLEPDYMKFDVSLVRHIDRSLIKRSLLEALVELSQKVGAQVIAEGIEDESELLTLRDLGVRLGQGRFLASPAPVPRAGE